MIPAQPDRSKSPPGPGELLLRPPWHERLCDAVVTGFALWTLCCHALVFAGGSLEQLIGLFVLVLSSFVLGRRWLRGRRGRADGDGHRGLATEALESFALPPALRWSLAALGGAAALALSRPATLLALWFAVAAVLAAAAGWLLFRPGDDRYGSTTGHLDRRGALLLLALALASCALALVAHKSNADDAFYISLAVAAVESPGSPMLAGDPMHGIDGLPLYISVYRVHSWEMLCAAVSYLTGLPAISVFHLAATALAAFLLPLAHAALFRRLLPGQWLLATGLVVIVLIGPGDAVRWPGQLAFLRPWQGKSLFLSVLTPLLYLYALRFTARPSPATWLRLAGAQVAAVGLTSSALWAAPVAVAFGLVAGLRRSLASLRTLALGLASSGYLLLLGAALKSSVAGTVKEPPTLSAEERISEVITMMLGAESPRLWAATAAAVAVAWALVPPGMARRFAVIVPLGAWLLFLNPYAGDWLMANVTHRPHWRAMWTLPLPMLIALALLAPVFAARWRRRSLLLPARAASLLLAALFSLFVPRVHNLSPENGVRFSAPGLKVPAADYAGARAVNRAFEPGTLVAAPPEINSWLPTFHRRVKPLFVRFYLRRMGRHLGEEELRRRDFIPRLVRGDTDWQGAARALRREIEAFPDIEGVVLPASRQRDAYREVLASLGFSRLESSEADALDLDFWRRGSA